MKYSIEIILAGYVGAVLFAPGLPAVVVLGVALLLSLTAVELSRRHGALSRASALAWWGPVHLLMLGSGGAGGPVTPLLAGWGALVVFALTRAMAASTAAAAGALIVAVQFWVGDANAPGLAEAMLALAVGWAGGAVAGAVLARDRGRDMLLERILEDADGADRRPGRGAAARRLNELAGALEMVRSGLGARRAVVWDLDPAAERARPRTVAGQVAPADVPLAGSPLRWVWEEAMPIRLDVPPGWALPDARVGAVSIQPGAERTSLLTLEWDPAKTEIDLNALREAAHYLAAFARMQEREAAGEANRARYDDMLAFVRALPGEVNPEAFPGALASTAAAVTGGTGALVARFEGENGRVVAVVGDDGGPAVGTFTDRESTCGRATRTRATVRVEHHGTGRGQQPLARPGERWQQEPRAVVAIPLLDAASKPRGVLVVWNARAFELDADAVRLLEVFAPIFALQLQHGSDLDALRERAEVDALTGLANRSVVDAKLVERDTYFNRYPHPLSLVSFDIDHFKNINDAHGHAAGDAVLRMIGRVVTDAIREVDLAARYGGEEFVVLLPETARAAAADVAERLRATIARTPVLWGGEHIQVRASFGVSSCPECVAGPSELMASADAMLYASKRDGRNRVSVAEFRSPA